jgi:hypothetical protein
MSSRTRMPSARAAQIALCLMAASVAVAVLCAATAQASYYRMVLCAANNGANGYQTATNTGSAQNPSGIFSFENRCGASSPFPAGNNGYLRIAENQASGNAGYGAFGSMSWTVPGYVDLVAGGGYTREPNAFNDGWRGRFWLEGWDGGTNNVLMQGAGVENNTCYGVCWATTPVFASHLWPFPGFGKYRRFVFEMTCFRQAGCDRSNFNAVDSNSLVLILNDTDNSRVKLTNTGSGILSGNWVRGTQEFTWDLSEEGSGLRFERVRIDGGTYYPIDYRDHCNFDTNAGVGEFARDFRPCPAGVWHHSFILGTSKLADGAHTIGVCAQDYGQWVGLNGSGGESCDERQVKVDNTPPAAPAGLSILTPTPARYSDQIGAQWTLPPDPGSPIAKVHYEILDEAGKIVVAEHTVSGTNSTRIDQLTAPKAAGAYRLRLWLEDQVGLTGPPASVPIPHDTTPPAAPQDVSVTAPETSRADQGFDVRWRNLTDAGAPIDALHYQVVNQAGDVVVPTKDLAGENPQVLADLEAPRQAGAYALRLWLSDAEGNVGAPAEAPLSYDCARSDAAGGQSLSAGAGEKLEPARTVRQGQGSMVGGSLRGAGGPVQGAALCVFSRVITDGGAEYIGTAITSKDGGYRFPLPPGPSREIVARYRDGHREIEAHTTVLTRVAPTLKLRKRVVHNKHKAWFYGDIPGPHNDNVVVVLQVKSGKGWRVYRRYRTRSGGHYNVGYRFTQTGSATTYAMRAQVRRTVGLPYEPGNSAPVRLRVLP